MPQRNPHLAQPGREQRGQPVHVLRDRLQPAWTVIDRVHARDDGEQRLRRADVAGRLFAADVLLARLQRHAQRAPSLRVLRHADDPSRHVPHVVFAAGEPGRVRPPIAQRHAESLR